MTRVVRCARRRRLDELLVERGLLESQRAATGYIMAGKVIVDGQREVKPGTLVPADADVRVKGIDMPFVGRGGLKLDHGLRVFGLDVSGKVVLDAGASTGGFTDCLIQRGAGRVYAVDVGFGQLAGKLRANPAVVCLERTNISDLEPGDLVPPPEMAVVDLSYLSLVKAIPIVARLITGPGDIVALVKPLFEDPRPAAIDDPGVHREVLARLVSNFDQRGFGIQGLASSPVLGSSGTAEFIIWLAKSPGTTRVAEVWNGIPGVVAEAQALRRRHGGDGQADGRGCSWTLRLGTEEEEPKRTLPKSR